ncbi:MAG: serine/threonine protein kinase [Myxococcales bacterium]|nr:serine/threonine protein kinase [Myxococcales bacterium]
MNDHAKTSKRTSRNSRSQLDPVLGQLIDGEFSIVRPIGTGSHADVFLAKQKSVGDRTVALKVLCLPYLSLREPDFRRASLALLREGKLLGALHAPCFVDIIRTGTVADKRPYLAMEYVEGPTMAKVLEKKTHLDLSLLRDIVVQLGEGLAELHSVGYVHRDVTPSNLLLTHTSLRTTRVKMVDFGTVTRINERADRYRVGYDLEHPLGTPAYMAPEQATGGIVDGRADQYGLAGIVYEALAGRRPVTATEPGPRGMLNSLRAETPLPEVSLGALRKDLPSNVVQAVDRALARDPEERHPHMGAFVQAFRAAVDRPSSHGKRSRLMGRFLGGKENR